MPEIPEHIRDKILSRSNYAVEEKLARRVRAALGLRPASLKALRRDRMNETDKGYATDWELVRDILYDLLPGLLEGGRKKPLHVFSSRCVKETEDHIRFAYPPDKGLPTVPTFFIIYPGGDVSVVTLMLRASLPAVPGKFSVRPFHGLIVAVDRPLADFAEPLQEAAECWKRHHNV